MKTLYLALWLGLTSMSTVPNEGSSAKEYAYASRIQSEESKYVMKQFGLNITEGELITMLPSICPIPEPDGVYISSHFGSRIHPIYKARHMHQGIDIAARKGTAVVATGQGKVLDTKLRRGYGKQIIIEHANGYRTRYAHLNTILVNNGDMVEQGDTIGTVGTTGLSTGDHLHYEIIHDNKVVNPLFMLPDTLQGKEYLAYSRKLNEFYKERSDFLFNI